MREKSKEIVNNENISEKLNELLKAIIILFVLAVVFGYIIITENIPTFVGIDILLLIVAIFIVWFLSIENKKNQFHSKNDVINEFEVKDKSVDNYKADNKLSYNYDVRNYIVENSLDRDDFIDDLEMDDIIDKYDFDDKIIDEYDIQDDIYDDLYNENDEILEYECERCFKKISSEEYELYDCMCEECYDDVHTDENGEFHEDEYFE